MIMKKVDEDVLKFAEWVSDNSYKKCINGEWIELGKGDYKIVAKSTEELYKIFSNSKCIILGCDNAYGFKKVCDINQVKEVCQDIWDNPEKYSSYSKGSDESYYSFLKFLWVEFPDGTKKNLSEMID